MERERNKNRNLSSVIKDVTEQNEDFLSRQQKATNELEALRATTRECKAQESKLTQLVELQWKQLEEKQNDVNDSKTMTSKLLKEQNKHKNDVETLQDELRNSQSELEILRAAEKQRIQITNRDHKALLVKYKSETEKWRSLVKSRNHTIKVITHNPNNPEYVLPSMSVSLCSVFLTY